eukprot:TRINITY_DN17141_c0_g1_i1.p2 TRINITY_DN17141_c0_g1~~TRINITY_DN17141_c0_g1_i1.p2  ORF type:complete len:251 (+),score=73.21 TRINITY_DN17141_c0_g1_i1:386-1138(+)
MSARLSSLPAAKEEARQDGDARMLDAGKRLRMNEDSESGRPHGTTSGGKAATGGASGSSGKNGAGSKIDSEKIPADKEMVPLLAGEVLKLMVTARHHSGMLHNSYKLVNEDLAKRIRETGQQYNKLTRGQKGHTHGSPWWHSWQTMLDWAKEELSKEHDKTKQEALENYLGKHPIPKTFYSTVKQLKVWQENGGEYHIMMMHLEGPALALWEQVLEPTLGEQVEPMPSPVAPPTPAERRLRKYCMKKGSV